MPSLTDKLTEATVKTLERRTEPPWDGPCSGEKGGVTQGLLGRYLQCPERFRLLVMDGLEPIPTFSHRMEYGQMWHICEEELATASGSRCHGKNGKKIPDWQSVLKEYCQKLCRAWPLSQEQIARWFEVCKAQFPIYVDYWSKHPDVRDREPLFQERTFDVRYPLPSGRVVRLRGKWDSVDLIGKGKSTAVYLQENKTKGDVDETKLRRQLASGFELQTMLYLVALQLDMETWEDYADGRGLRPLAGVRYNVVRRPLSGGKGSISQSKGTKGSKCSKCDEAKVVDGRQCPKCKGFGRIGGNPPETDEQFYRRLGQVISDDPGTFFMRWKVEVLPSDVEKFRRACLDPVLENLCDDYEWWAHCRDSKLKVNVYNYLERANAFPHHRRRHFRMPYIGWNVLSEGGMGDVDDYLNTGSTVGLHRDVVLFKELA